MPSLFPGRPVPVSDADRNHFDPDLDPDPAYKFDYPDPAFHLDPDLTFHFDADPGPHHCPVPT
jgi:hypothetical protein